MACLSLFDTGPGMLATGPLCPRWARLFDGFFGLGLVLYFASRGAGRMTWPVTAQFLRLVMAGGGSAIALRMGGELETVFLMIGLALAVFGPGVTASIAGGVWSLRR